MTALNWNASNDDLANTLEANWNRWDAACKEIVADEVCAHDLEAALSDPSALMKKYPRSTFAAAQEAAEHDIRNHYDTQRVSEMVLLETDTEVLAGRIAQAIAAKERVTRLSARQTNPANALLGTVVEELQLSRLEQQLPSLTVGALAAAYAGWTDADHPTALDHVEAAVLGGRLDALGLRHDPERDAIEIPRLKQAVIARRQQRVGPELPALLARVNGLRTNPRRDLVAYLREGRGIASRPRMDAA